MSGNFLTIPGEDAIGRRSRSSSLTDLISAFDNKAQAHTELQKITAFSGQFDKNHKPTFSKDEYGKPIPGSKTEYRGAEAQARVCTEMKELCEIIHDYGKTPCKGLLPPELKDATKVISFGELFTIYTVISDKLVGLLLRTRKYQLTYFEGEVLFQKRDDDVPIFLMQPIEEIREYCNNKALQARRSVSPMPN
ncbi:actin-binding Rho-activating protein-like isoform X1 [Maniola hyperantus]|uniref:actin-binding Rho-activating protein-like isoform X1 n=1 Tax=Aphantopus hyperantus TaxID=2795564 RepID=UPI00156A5877|nr:actin-binding Rho-activating protein-like [Maniola hyperantus]